MELWATGRESERRRGEERGAQWSQFYINAKIELMREYVWG
jgi:hypothetical protein